MLDVVIYFGCCYLLCIMDVILDVVIYYVHYKKTETTSPKKLHYRWVTNLSLNLTYYTWFLFEYTFMTYTLLAVCSSFCFPQRDGFL